jgi:hypothetical protein
LYSFCSSPSGKIATDKLAVNLSFKKLVSSIDTEGEGKEGGYGNMVKEALKVGTDIL